MGASTKQAERLTNDYESTNRFIRLNLLYFTVIFLCVVGMLFTSCKKDIQPDNKDKLLNISVKTEGLHVQQMKSWSLSDWVYSYNPGTYELKFTGTKNTYTFNKSISELQAGFNISVIPDNYVITYISTHTGELSNTLDISINDIKNITTNDPITLQGHNDDYLVILDVLTSEYDTQDSYSYIYVNGGYNSKFYHFQESSQGNKYKYGYYNVEGDLMIKYDVFNNITGAMETKFNTIPNATKNNIYHIVNSLNGGVGINIVPFTENLIGW